MVFLKISQNSQENTYARVFFSMKLQVLGLKIYLKRDSSKGLFLWVMQNFQEHLFLQNISGGFFCFFQQFGLGI